MPQMVIANTLKDGRVVFLADHGQWVNGIAEGFVVQSEQEAEELAKIATRAEAENRVVDPELIEVTNANGHPRPVEIREAIRAEGPAVRGHPGEGN